MGVQVLGKYVACTIRCEEWLLKCEEPFGMKCGATAYFHYVCSVCIIRYLCSISDQSFLFNILRDKDKRTKT
jgi:hypothetical protein